MFCLPFRLALFIIRKVTNNKSKFNKIQTKVKKKLAVSFCCRKTTDETSRLEKSGKHSITFKRQHKVFISKSKTEL